MADRVQTYDTTLRDGTQREGISYSCDDKLRIAERLDELGVTFIEGGWPGSNPKDADFFRRAKDRRWKNAALTAFGSTRRADIAPQDDPQLAALLAAETPVCTIFGKTWTLHVHDVLRTTLDENLRMIEDSVRYLREAGRRVVYDAEHFFDGYEADAAYALATLHAAARGGAESIVLCDTNGGTMPWRIEEVVSTVTEDLRAHPRAEGEPRGGGSHGEVSPKAEAHHGRGARAPLPERSEGIVVGIHAHDDAGCAVANSLAALRAGARHVQGTINGYGERCGNANLCAIVPTLELKMGLNAVPEGHLSELYELARFVAEVANLPPDEHQAYVGRSAFAHKGGVHVAAMRRSEASYQHVDPTLVGNRSRVVVSELSGRGNVLAKAEELGVTVGEGAERDVLEHIKASEARGFSYEAAEASVALLVARQSPDYRPPFEVLDFQVTSGRRGDHDFSEATVKVAVGERIMHTAAEGNGPVSALDTALRKALEPVYPELRNMHLVDYKVRILDGSSGTRATTRVLIDHADDHRGWSTVGASSNIIEASMQAVVDGIEHGLGLMDAPRTESSTKALGDDARSASDGDPAVEAAS